jgi:chromatin remodeling complex protein RSC6
MTEVQSRKRVITVRCHIDDYDALLKILDEEIDRKSRQREGGIRALRKTRKTILKMKKDVPHVIRSSRRTSAHGNVSAFMVEKSITPEFAKFLQVSPDTKITRTDATRALCAYSHLREGEDRPGVLKWAHLNTTHRNLQDPERKRAIAPDSKLSRLLNYDQYKKDVAAGIVSKMVRDKETGLKNRVIVDDDSMYYWVLQKLMTSLFVSDEK